jgi:hypothetical protein
MQEKRQARQNAGPAVNESGGFSGAALTDFPAARLAGCSVHFCGVSEIQPSTPYGTPFF